jgi:hypothetical protein
MQKEFRHTEKLKSKSGETRKAKITVSNNVLRKQEFDTEKFWYYYTEIRKE